MASEVTTSPEVLRGRATPAPSVDTPTDPLRLAFIGVGWIGRLRMRDLLDTGLAEAAVLMDPSPESIEAAREIAPAAELAKSVEDALSSNVDGVVIATPNQLHVEQCLAAFDAGLPVFCQKPLARTADQVQRVVDAARGKDLLLGVDLSYRKAEAFARVRREVQTGRIGEPFAVEAVFHNAYGPDKAWCRDPDLSGGGCVLDLGIHMADLALWALDHPPVEDVSSRLYAQGRLLGPDPSEVEDYAAATIHVGSGATVNLACSWNVHAGRDCVIDLTVHGTDGAVRARNVDGSFFDFVCERYEGCNSRMLVEPPDAWSHRELEAWTRRVANGDRFDAENARQYVQVARVLDGVYGR